MFIMLQVYLLIGDNMQVRQKLEESNGTIFAVQFIKKDGSIRDMVARTGVTRHLKGGTLGYNPEEHGLKTVFDMQKGQYRMINLDTVTWLKTRGRVYNAINGEVLE